MNCRSRGTRDKWKFARKCNDEVPEEILCRCAHQNDNAVRVIPGEARDLMRH